MIEQLDTDKALIKYYMPYAMKTITDRALPDVRDGLKPIHRRILWKLYSIGCTYDKPRMKCGTIVGDILKIHNHGDISIYNALALLTEQNESLLTPFIDGEGAFGKVYSKDSPAAMRYTFARLNKFSEEMFKDINKDIVKFIGEDKEHSQPLALNNTFPNILLKPNSGMAVGEACNWASFNLIEVINTTIFYIKDKNINLLDSLIAPDFSTGGYIIYNKDNLNEIYNTGKGSFKLRSKYTYDEKNHYIEIYEIPYNTDVDTITSEIKKIIKDGKFKDILDIRDETGFNKQIKKEQLKITIDIRKNADINKVMNYLYKTTSLEKSFSCNFNALVNYKPRVLGIKQVLDEWLNFRTNCIKKSLNFDINKKSIQLHSLLGLEKVLINIDKAISIIRNSKDDNTIINNLMKEFNIDKLQSEDIANMKLRNINNTFILNKIKSINILKLEIEKLKNIVKSENEINEIIIEELKRVRDNYGQPRKTEIIYEDNIQEMPNDSFIEDYSTYCILTKENYLKKLLKKSDTIKLKENDEILYQTYSSNKATLLLFSSLGNCYKIYEHELQENKPSELGQYLPSLLQLDKDEQIIAMITTSTYSGNLIEIFENGSIASIKLESFKTESKRSQLKNALSLKSKLIKMFIAEKDTDILLKSSLDKVLITNTSIIPPKDSKNTQGNMIMKSKNNSIVVLAELLENIDTDKIEDIEYYKNESGKGIGVYQKKIDEIVLK